MKIKNKLEKLFYINKDLKIVYYPSFDSIDELTSHYYRACWYFPSQNNNCQEVHLYKHKDIDLGNKPDYMAHSNVSTQHIKVYSNISSLKKDAKTATVVLLWKKSEDNFIHLLKQRGVSVINVDTNDEEAAEYGRYCDLIWNYFKTDKDKKKIIQDSYNKFVLLSNKIKSKGLYNGCVFGTGPSLETAMEFDFSNCVSVVCNSIVQNKELLSHIKPYFITAGDVISHLGVSLYAEVFRKDLINYLKNSEAYYLTTAPFGYLLLEQCPEISDKIILVEQLNDEQNYDLLHFFGLPKLDSTFNIHMLPIIHTFCKNIFILGCDGKSKVRNNEDFWAHAQESQYFELVQTGHTCHPTFDINRKKNTYTRYQDSVTHSITNGEEKNGKRYYTLQQSYTDALENKNLPEELRIKYNNQNQLAIAEIFTYSNEIVNEDADIKQGIKFLRDNEDVMLTGWCLSKTPIMIEVYVDDKFAGYAVKNQKRPDIFKRFPEYNDTFSGLYFYIKNKKEVKIRWRIISGSEVVAEGEKVI